MFESLIAAQQYLAERHLPRDQIELIVDNLVPAIAFKPIAGAEITMGATRLGGAPDLPDALSWPRIETPDNAEEIAKRGSSEAAAATLQHLRAGLPYTFMAQIGLADASAIWPDKDDLPEQGRLLFFYDVSAGPYDPGARSARVVWDQSPVDTLKPAPLPSDLVEADASYRQMRAGISKEYGMEPPAPQIGTPYIAKAQPLHMGLTYKPPSQSSVEFDRDPAFATLVQSESSDGSNNAAVAAYSELHEQASGGMEAQSPGKMKRTQFLGSPWPEQDDPRYHAVIVSDYGKPYLSSQEWALNKAQIMQRARDWRLLLQVEYADFVLESADGTIFFLIRNDDLKARRFDKVVAVYQQT